MIDAKPRSGWTRRALLAAGAAVPIATSAAWCGRRPDRGGSILLRDHGARGDGVSDDRAALAAALVGDAVLDGEGRTFAIDGDIVVSGRCGGLVNATLRQLAPASDHRRTLLITGASGFRLENLTILRGGTGDEIRDRAAMDDTFGLFLHDCADFSLADVHVSGGGIGTGIGISSCRRFTTDRIGASAIHWRLPMLPSDDAIQGIWFNDCSDFTATGTMARDIGGFVDGRMSHDINRGIAIGGCSRFTLRDAHVSQVGQGIDVSGSAGNGAFVIDGGVVEDCATWGFKFANSAHDGRILNAVARRCGIGGFVASAPGPDVQQWTRALTFEDCRAEDVLGNYPPGQSFGFGVLGNDFTHDQWPRGVVFRHCAAITAPDRGRMLFGFRNDVPAAATQGQPNRVIDCQVAGAAEEPYHGF